VPYTCRSQSLLGTNADGALAALPLFCGRWDCEECGEYKRKRLRKRLLDGEPTTLITLTTNPAVHASPLDAFLNATTAINKLFKRLRRRFPTRKIEYALVWETTKKGWPHAHILLRSPYLPQNLISRLWVSLTGAFIVDVRKVASRAHAAAYVTKYLTKSPEVPSGYRRFRTSRLYAAPPPRGVLREYLSIDGFDRYPFPVSILLQEFSSYGRNWTEHWPSLWLSQAPPLLVGEAERG